MDTLIRFGFNQRVRGQIVRLDKSWLPIVTHHQQYGQRDVPPTVRERLGELSSAALLLATSLKFDGSLLLQIQGTGPARLFLAECRADGRFRATVKLNESAPIPHDASFQDLVNPDGQGRFAVTLVPAKKDEQRGMGPENPYQGIIPFEGDTVAEVLEHYMTMSEQLPTRMWLAASEQAAFGLLLQVMPGTSDEDQDGHNEGALLWEQVQALADTLTREEMLTLPPEEILRRLFWETNIQAFDLRKPVFSCTCSRDKVAGMLKMLGEVEVRSILAEQDGEIQVHCEFCRLPYRFDENQALALFDEPDAATDTSEGATEAGSTEDSGADTREGG
ncbi:MAG: Hsp33 family molecular chaperone HslO [Lautropia sp.]|nr:Hsp33 family molecular chaperone HslO [Lautropia sp.]